MYAEEQDGDVISYSSFYELPEELVLREDLTIVDDLTTFIVNEYMRILLESDNIEERISAIHSLYEWIDYSIHLNYIFTLNRMVINESSIRVKKEIISLLKYIKKNRK